MKGILSATVMASEVLYSFAECSLGTVIIVLPSFFLFCTSEEEAREEGL